VSGHRFTPITARLMLVNVVVCTFLFDFLVNIGVLSCSIHNGF